MDRIRDDVGDTLRVLGSRVLQDGALVYGHIKVAASAQGSLHHALDTLGSTRGRKRHVGPVPVLAPATPAAPEPVPGPAPEPAPVTPPPKQDAA